MRKDARNVTLGALVAGTVGFVAGILTAPKSGRETRTDIQKAASKAKNEADKTLKRLHTELGELITKGKQKAQSAKDTAKKELTEALSKAQTAKDKARVVLSAIHEGDADDKDLKKAIDEANSAVEHLKKYVNKGKTKAAK